MDLQPQQKLGQYTVVRKLAVGGMAEIYLATRTGASGFAKTCVLKRVKAEFRRDQKFRQMFEAEARLAANLEHSNIVQIFDFQSGEDGELYLAMQYVDGCSLNQLRLRLPEGRLPPFLAARITRDVANALAYAYSATGPDGQRLRLVHRDVSPHNVLVSSAGEVKLTDFGIAKPVSQETSGGFKGKIAYMAPEQARGARVDNRTDLFALGVVLFELVTGSRPYDAPNDIAFIHEMSTGSSVAPRASQMGVPVPEELADIIAKAVERQADQRYQAAEELVRALDGFLRLAQGDVDTDLGRFITERLGSLSAPPAAPSPLLPTGAFEDTQLSIRSKPREPTAVAGARDSGEFALPPGPEAASTPAPKRREPTAVLGGAAAPRPEARLPSDLVSRPTVEPPAVEGRPVTSQSRPTEKGVPSVVDERPPAGVLTPAMKAVMGVAGLAALIGGAAVTYYNSRPSSSAGDGGTIVIAVPIGSSTSSTGSASSRSGTTSTTSSSGMTASSTTSAGSSSGSAGTATPAVEVTPVGTTGHHRRNSGSAAHGELVAVKFVAIPWAHLYVDGTADGEINGSGLRDIAVGHHRAAFKNGDQTKTTEFDVVSGQLNVVKVNMMGP